MEMELSTELVFSLETPRKLNVELKKNTAQETHETWHGKMSDDAPHPLRTVARATRLTPRVKATMRRSQLWLRHISFTSLNPRVMYVRSSEFTFSSSHMNAWMF
jgi:hypothetical protein